MSGGGGGGGGGGAVVGEGTRLVPAREPAVFEVLTTPGGGTFTKGEVRLSTFNIFLSIVNSARSISETSIIYKKKKQNYRVSVT